MRRHRTAICLMAGAAIVLFAQMPLLAAVIGISFCAWIIAAALLPAPADETTIKETTTWHQHTLK